MNTGCERPDRLTLPRESDLAAVDNLVSPGHSTRVGALATQVALAMGMGSFDALLIGQAARWHDIGKIAVPSEVLGKPDKLTASERRVVDRHVWHGKTLLSQRPSPLASLAADIALWHHERYDGLGHPHNLRGSDIPLPVRIVSVVDVFDALSNDRPYKAAWPRDQVVAHFEDARGRAFDPRCVDALLQLLEATANPSPYLRGTYALAHLFAGWRASARNEVISDKPGARR